VCLSKSLSGYGLPLAITLVKPEHDVFAPGEHNGTFRGNNTAFVTATEALRFWENDHLEKDVARKAGIVRAGFQEIADAHPAFEPTLKGRGLMQGIAINQGEAADEICAEAFERGLILETAGSDGEVVKCLCPLTISDHDLYQGLAILKEAFTTVASRRHPAKNAA
jgi:diaminobutyrate-2-oxoglutarate transaminase